MYKPEGEQLPITIPIDWYKELEMANKNLIGMTDVMANQIAEYKVIDKGQLERIKELEADLDDRKREVNLRCGQIQERDIRIAELTAKLDKAKEALSMASWNQIGGYEGQQKWMELNKELDK